MKVKFANRVFEVLYTKETAGLTMYAVEDEPNHIDWLTNVEVVDDDKKELKIGNEIEIPFGAKDSELQVEIYNIPEGFHAEIDDDKVVIKKGKKPATWSEEDEYNYNTILHHLDLRKEKYKKECNQEEQDRYQGLYNWLKSLKDRYTWKPSDEQMDALDGICSYIRNKADWEISQDMVSDLYKLSEQLKKLKGE